MGSVFLSWNNQAPFALHFKRKISWKHSIVLFNRWTLHTTSEDLIINSWTTMLWMQDEISVGSGCGSSLYSPSRGKATLWTCFVQLLQQKQTFKRWSQYKFGCLAGWNNSLQSLSLYVKYTQRSSWQNTYNLCLFNISCLLHLTSTLPVYHGWNMKVPLNKLSCSYWEIKSFFTLCCKALGTPTNL